MHSQRDDDGSPAILVSGLAKSYPGSRGRPGNEVLADFDLAVPGGQTLGIIGPNGAGKTTLMLLLLGFLRPDGGTVRVLSGDPAAPQTRRITGYLPESFVPPQAFSGEEYLFSMARLYGYERQAARSRAEEVIEAFELEERAGQTIAQYSKGTLRRLGLARAFLNQPQLVLLDEPTISLDPPSVLRLRDVIARSKLQGTTIVLVTHHLSEVERVCDRVLLLRKGEIRGDYDLTRGETTDLFELFGEGDVE